MPARMLLVAVATVAVALTGCAQPSRLSMAEVADGATAPEAADLVAGDDRTAAAWIQREVRRTDRPVVVKFFASWCGPCDEEVPVLQQARRTHPEAAFLGIAHQDPREQARAWMAEHGIEDLPTVLDLEGTTARTFGARGMPSVSFVDADGRLQHTHTGPIDEGLLDEWIDHLAGAGPRPDTRPDAPAAPPG